MSPCKDLGRAAAKPPCGGGLIGTWGTRRPVPLTSLASSHHIPTSLLTAQKFLPVLSTHGAFIHSPYTSLLLSGTLFPANPLFPIHFAGLTLEVSSSRKPPTIGPLQYGSDPPLRCTSKGVLLSPPPSLLGVAAALLLAVSSRGQNPSPLCSALGPTPLIGH